MSEPASRTNEWVPSPLDEHPAVRHREAAAVAALAARARPFVYRQQTYVDAGMGNIWEEQAAFGYANGIAIPRC